MARTTPEGPTALDRKVVHDGNVRDWKAVLDTRIEEIQSLMRRLIEDIAEDYISADDIDRLVSNQNAVYDTELGAALANFRLLAENEQAVRLTMKSYGLQ